MTWIVGVHGIAQQFRGGYQLRNAWLDALRDGLVVAGHRSAAATLVPDDMRVAFFGDLFRPRGSMAGAGAPVSAEVVQPGLELDLLRQWYDAAVAQDSSLGAPEGAMGQIRNSVHVMLDRLLRSPTFAKVAQNALVRDLKQVNHFLGDYRVKQSVLARVDEEVDTDTRVLIGHSLGSVVAYEYLCHYQPASVQLLVTLGSPLGIPNLVFDRLTPAPIKGAGVWPETVGAWVNVADPDDIVALRKDLAPLFPGRSPGTMIADRLVDNGNEPHAIDRYLNAWETGSAIGDVLG
jgi:PGAP1-like protein